MARMLAELGYIGFAVSDLKTWENYAATVLGLAARPGPIPGSLLLRMDAYDRRIILVEGDGDDIAFVGWLSPSETALEAFAAHLARHNVGFAWGDATDASLRGVDRLLHFQDPNGVRHEAFCGPLMGADAFVSPRVAAGYATGAGGLGHVVFGTNNYAACVAFAQDIIGLAMTDIIRQPIAPHFTIDVSFLHINERHHSLAYANLAGPKKLHHFMVQVHALADVGRARDRSVAFGMHTAQDIGQHSNDRMVSFYATTPSGFFVEYGTGAVTVHDNDWQVVTYPVMSEWGHRPVAAGNAPGGAIPERPPAG